jgi:dihydroflavonol-4-reductase
LTETILVTGATGFIGSALCRALLNQGYKVRALHRETSSLAPLEGLPVERVVGDILKPSTLPAALEGADALFHSAAQPAYWKVPRELVRTSAIDGTRNVFEVALRAGIKRAVLTSSMAALGVPNANELLTENHTFNIPPRHFLYGYAKHQSELEALKYSERGLEVVIVIPTIVLGPGDINQNSGKLVVECAKGSGFFWTDGGVNLVHIEDVVAGHIAALLHGRSGERYILGGENVCHRDVFTTVNEIVGRRPPWLKIPTSVINPAAQLIEWLRPLIRLPISSEQLRMGQYYLYFDLSKSQRELKLPPPRPFRMAAQETFDWYRQQGVL